MENNWKGIKEAITSTCHVVLGHKKHHHKEWITVDTLDKIQEGSNQYHSNKSREIQGTSRIRKSKQVDRTLQRTLESISSTEPTQHRSSTQGPSNQCCPPTNEEISMAIRQIKSGKTARSDIPAEVLKADVAATATPTDWEGHLIKMPEKGDLNKCENYEGITLLSIPESLQ
ncbi:unnamed protein product [Schistosoma mattheei]|uniref:Uncharacterized protein n=1 Tax=Schistosoma mattheei TaxID=31246 RepID=A0A183NNI9_9TREM|nr:unnamed protein product [Schistosoma mattheei]